VLRRKGRKGPIIVGVSQTGKWADAWQPGIAAIRGHWRPILAIQILAILIAVAYHERADVRDAAHGLEQLKRSSGILFAFVAGAMAGGLVPEFAKLVTGHLRKFDRIWLGNTVFNGLVYGFVGVQVDLFYQLQARMFGNGIDLGTLVVKTLVDMGIFAPLLSIPSAVLLYEGRKLKWHGVVKACFRPAAYRELILPKLVVCWAFWIPVLFGVYAMPGDLQLCLALLAEAAWSILFVFIATEG